MIRRLLACRAVAFGVGGSSRACRGIVCLSFAVAFLLLVCFAFGRNPEPGRTVTETGTNIISGYKDFRAAIVTVGPAVTASNPVNLSQLTAIVGASNAFNVVLNSLAGLGITALYPGGTSVIYSVNGTLVAYMTSNNVWTATNNFTQGIVLVPRGAVTNAAAQIAQVQDMINTGSVYTASNAGSLGGNPASNFLTNKFTPPAYFLGSFTLSNAVTMVSTNYGAGTGASIQTINAGSGSVRANINLAAGTSSDGQGGGVITISGGRTNNTAGGITITGGNSVLSNKLAGSVVIGGGADLAMGAPGGVIYVNAGFGGNSGGVQLYGGHTTAPPGADCDGILTVNGGGTNGVGAAAYLTGGSSTAGDAAHGAEIYAGGANTNGVGGSAQITGGSSTNLGGDVLIRGGSGTNGNGTVYVNSVTTFSNNVTSTGTIATGPSGRFVGNGGGLTNLPTSFGGYITAVASNAALGVYSNQTQFILGTNISAATGPFSNGVANSASVILALNTGTLTASLSNIVAAGSCTNCEVWWDANGRVTNAVSRAEPAAAASVTNLATVAAKGPHPGVVTNTLYFGPDLTTTNLSLDNAGVLHAGTYRFDLPGATWTSSGGFFLVGGDLDMGGGAINEVTQIVATEGTTKVIVAGNDTGTLAASAGWYVPGGLWLGNGLWFVGTNANGSLTFTNTSGHGDLNITKQGTLSVNGAVVGGWLTNGTTAMLILTNSAMATNTAPGTVRSTTAPAMNQVRTNGAYRLAIWASFHLVNGDGGQAVADIYTARNNVTNHFGPVYAVGDFEDDGARALTAGIDPSATYWPSNVLGGVEETIDIDNWLEKVQ